ncbi:hypothetical protein C8Q76DRAFT_723011 [Earliella scabrosa]|nr:hypothetical protein C8Q76DRAFT_723011 [Earliella scabrosa]
MSNKPRDRNTNSNPANSSSVTHQSKQKQAFDAAISTGTTAGTNTSTDSEPDQLKLARVRQGLAFLCHDLRTFSANADAAARLNASVHAHFLGAPYLSAADADFVHSCALSALRLGLGESDPLAERGGSGSGPQAQAQVAGRQPEPETLPQFLEKSMDALMQTRKAKSERDAADGGGKQARDFVVCTSHDLAPLLQEACGFPKQYFETRAFKDAYKRWEKEVRKAAKKGRGPA